MALRNLAGGAARMTAGFWREFADTVDPSSPDRDQVAEREREAADPAPASPAAPVIPEGGMLVPIDSWTRMMEQLGNLHQAGQELAEARERAAKAETEAAFLREQLSDMRARQRRRKPPADAKPAPAQAVTPTDGSTTSPGAISRARTRVSGWVRRS